jgi:membrane protein required for colicin V production
MTLFDLILFLILFGFIWFGLWHGLIRTISGILSFVLSLVLAGRWYEFLAIKILPFLKDNFLLARILAFLIIFALAQAIFFFIFRALNKIFDFSILKIFNRLAGALFGFFEGALIIGLVLYFSSKLPLGSSWSQLLEDSFLAGILMSLSNILLPLIPRAIKEAQSLI